jgi:predicted CoA-binding protein
MNVTALCRQLLERDRVIAVVGWSIDARRPSHDVTAYMHAHGYRMIPVNPSYAGHYDATLAATCYASLAQAAQALAAEGAALQMVNVFRRAEAVPALVDEALAVGARSLWLQQGVVHQDAAAVARHGGMDVVMDRCLKIEYARALAKRP